MLHIWLRGQHSPLLLWLPEQKSWQEVAGWSALNKELANKFGKKSAEQPVCVYFPTRHLQQLTTELSATQLKQLGDTGKQYLFEETSLTPADKLSVKDVAAPTGHVLYAVAQADIAAWQSSAQIGDLNIVALLPDFLLLPIPSDGAGQQLSLYQDEQTTLVRQTELQGMAVGFLPMVIERLPHLSEICVLKPAKFNEVEQGDATRDDATHNELDNPKSTQAPLNDVGLNELAMPDNSQVVITPLPITAMPVINPERHPLNFVNKPASFALSPYLKTTVMVLAAALVLQLSADALQAYRYNQAMTATKLATKTQYDAWFPNEPLSTRTKLDVQLQPKLTSGEAQPSTHLALLNRIAPLIKQSALVAQSLVIEPTSLSFVIVGDNRASLDKFASILSKQGIDASLGRVANQSDASAVSTNQADDGQINRNTANKVTGEITINIATQTPPTNKT